MTRFQRIPVGAIEVRDVCLWFQDGGWKLQALDRVSFSVREREFVTLLGPNGCGKSTLLKLIAGLLPPSEGSILQRGEPLGPPDGSRMLMFQDRTLFPWRTVGQNVDFGLLARGVDRRMRPQRVREVLEITGLVGFERAYPHQLSSGMRQRAELARALALEPSVLLLDEPFAAVDSLTRDVLQEELLRHRERTEAAFLMVTHDIREAVFLSDRILLMSKRPGTITRSIRVEPDGERGPKWRAHPRYGELCFEILSLLRKEISEDDGDDSELAGGIGER